MSGRRGASSSPAAARASAGPSSSAWRHDGWATVGIEIDPATAADADALAARPTGCPGTVHRRGRRRRCADLERARDAATALAPLRGWVNNAAIVAKDSVHVPDPEAVERLFRVNVDGTYWGARWPSGRSSTSAPAGPS